MDQCDETGILYISGYYTTDGKSSAILAVDTATGELTAEYILLNAGGTPFDGHVGGVAVSEDTLYVSGQKQNGLYTICAIPLKDLPAEGSHEVKLEQTIPVPVSPSFLSCSHGYLWVGNFYHPGADYPLSDGMKYTTASADGEDYGCYIMGYDLSKGSLSVADGDDYAQPDVVLVGPAPLLAGTGRDAGHHADRAGQGCAGLHSGQQAPQGERDRHAHDRGTGRRQGRRHLCAV